MRKDSVQLPLLLLPVGYCNVNSPFHGLKLRESNHLLFQRLFNPMAPTKKDHLIII